MFEKQLEASVAGKKWRICRVRGDEIEQRKMANSYSESKEWKFSPKCYMKPLKDYEGKKPKKLCVIHSVSLVVDI